MKNLFIIAACVVILMACKPHQTKKDSVETPDITISGDTVLIPGRSPVGQKIKQLTLRSESVLIPYSTTGTVRAIPECIADIAVPFEGRIVRSFVKAGQTVKAGSPLFSIHSPAFFETVKSYLQAKQEKQVAEMNLHRQQDLVDHGVGVQKELDEARLNFEISKGQVENLVATLSIYNVNAEKTEVGKPMVVTSPIKGEVVKNTIRVGQYLTANSDPMVCIADLKKVWVIAQVKESKMGLIQHLDEVKITIDAYPKQTFTGFVSYIGKILDEQSRSLEVIIECENAEQYLKPGTFTMVNFMNSHQEGIVLPATALIQEEDHTYVYKKTGSERFVKTPVNVTSAGNGNVIVMDGVAAGETVISEGCIYLH